MMVDFRFEIVNVNDIVGIRWYIGFGSFALKFNVIYSLFVISFITNPRRCNDKQNSHNNYSN